MKRLNFKEATKIYFEALVCSLVNSTKCLRKKLFPFFYYPFWDTEAEGILLNSFSLIL